MAELTKEQQVRALREARFKKRHATPTPLHATPPPLRTTAVCPHCLLWEAEVKRLKRELATIRMKQELAIKLVKPPALSNTERSRRFRAKRKQANDE